MTGQIWMASFPKIYNIFFTILCIMYNTFNSILGYTLFQNKKRCRLCGQNDVIFFFLRRNIKKPKQKSSPKTRTVWEDRRATVKITIYIMFVYINVLCIVNMIMWDLYLKWLMETFSVITP